MNYLKYYIVFIVLFFFTSVLNAQESNCALKLDEAENLYEMGELDSIPSLLRSCINDGFENEELSRAYKLLIRTYLFEDYQEMAELTMLTFLKKFPEYELKANDPIEFTYLYKSYKTVPIFSIGIIGGLNYSFVRIITPYSLDDAEDYSGEYSVSGIGYQVGLQLKRYITDEIEINVDGIYVNKKFDYTIEQLDSKLNYKESQTHLSFPISGTYDFKYKMLRPFVRFGFTFDYLIGSTASVERSFTGDNNREALTGPDIDIIDDRNPLNFSLLFGAGIKYDLKKNGYFMLDLRYNLGLTNSVNGKTRFSNDEKIYYYNYVDDDFALSNMYISVGYAYPFYRTKYKK
jgi:hypothetical protein